MDRDDDPRPPLSIRRDEGRQLGLESAAPEPPAPRRRPWRVTLLGLVGLVALIAWGGWWASSLRRGHLTNQRLVWFFSLPNLFGDFEHNIYYPTQVWLRGGNPYLDTNRTFCFPYPPLVLRLFSWGPQMSVKAAGLVWFALLIGMVCAGTWAALRSRQRLGLQRVPISLALAALLLSTPVMLAMERGNYDLLVVALLLAALATMKRQTLWGDLAAGALLAVAFWAKLYPGLIGIGLLALRRWRVVPGLVVTAAAIGLADLPNLWRCIANIKRMTPYCRPSKEHFWVDVHSLTGSWKVLWWGGKYWWVGFKVPDLVAVALILGPPLAWVSYRVFLCPRREQMAYPYLLWVLALATFVPGSSVDYNLTPLLLAAVAAWDRRDPVPVHMLMGLLALWWQPLYLPIDGQVMLIIKLLGLLAVGASVAGRARELSACEGDETAGASKSHVGRGASALAS